MRAGRSFFPVVVLALVFVPAAPAEAGHRSCERVNELVALASADTGLSRAGNYLKAADTAFACGMDLPEGSAMQTRQLMNAAKQYLTAGETWRPHDRYDAFVAFFLAARTYRLAFFSNAASRVYPNDFVNEKMREADRLAHSVQTVW